MAKDEKEREIQKMMQQRHANRTARKEQRMLERAQKAAESEQQNAQQQAAVAMPAGDTAGTGAVGNVQAEAGGPLRNEPYASPVQNPVWLQQQQNHYGFDPQQPTALYYDVNAANAAGAAQAAKEAEAEKQLQQQPAVRNYDDLYSTLMQQQMEQYNKDAEALARRRRSQEAIGSIADAAGAVANLIATNNYAPNQQVQTPMSAKARERYDRARAELDKSNAQQMAYLNQMEKARKAGNDATYRQMLMDWRNNETARKAAATEQQYALLVLRADQAQQKLDAMIKNNEDKNEIAKQRLEVDRLKAQVYAHNSYYGKPQYDVYEETVEHDPITDTDKTKVTKKTYTKSKNGGKKQNPMGGSKKENPMNK